MQTTEKQPPSFIISGTSSGSGKTTVSLGLMAAFKNKGFQVNTFKCGPDFIDPSLHQLITQKASRNLDIWMCGRDFVHNCFNHHGMGGDINVIEGVMGMFDGGESSSGSLAKELGIGTILVLDVRSMAESSGAIVKGFESFDKKCTIHGVILNKVASPRHLELVSKSINTHCTSKILGYLPHSLNFEIPSRHLGLITGDESPISPKAIDKLGDTVAQHIDLDQIISIAKQNSQPTLKLQPVAKSPTCCKIGVARDKAFCFYYQDNLELLQNVGAEIVYFSPLTDEKLPEGLDGIYLGGGYPELYTDQLSANKKMIKELHDWAENGHVIYAECGGFMYLTKGISCQDNTYHPMVGVFPFNTIMQTKRASLGYREVTTTQQSCLGPTGTVLRGHEFHYSKIDGVDDTTPKIYSVNNNTSEGYSYKQVLGGYMHLHFGYNPEVTKHFINFCKENSQ